MILQRPVAPAGLPSVSSILTNVTGRSRASKRRRCGGIVVTFSIVALGAIFFIAEWRTETLLVASSASAKELSTQAVAPTPPPKEPSEDHIEVPQSKEESIPQAGGPQGLPKTFGSFRAFVVRSLEYERCLIGSRLELLHALSLHFASARTITRNVYPHHVHYVAQRCVLHHLAFSRMHAMLGERHAHTDKPREQFSKRFCESVPMSDERHTEWELAA